MPEPIDQSSVARIGFIGTGTMGAPMAMNLLKAGYSVTVFNRNAAKCSHLAEAGATVAECVADLSSNSQIIVLMVSDDPAVKSIVQSDAGILHHAKPGTLVIDSTTVHPETSRQVAARLADRKIAYLDAPVTGSRRQAEEGKLLFLVGGAESACRKAAPILDAMGRAHVYLGSSGSGSCAKLGNNMLGLIHMAAFAEALSLIERFGLDRQKFYDIISQSGGRSAMSDLKGPKIIKEDWHADFALALAHKDLNLARSLAGSLNHSAPVLESAAHVFARALESIGGDGDFCSVYRWYQQQSKP